MRVEYSSYWSRLARWAMAVTLAATLVVPVLAAQSASAADTSTFTFSGGGYGHSVGLSQFGAYGMAREGYSWSEIMTHYFTGATPAPVDTTLSARPLWVNLQVERATVAFTVRSTGSEPSVPVSFTSSAGTVTATAGQTVTITRSGSVCSVSAPGGSLSGSCSIDATWDGWNGDPTTALVIGDCTLTNWNLTSGSRQQPCTYARGTIHLRSDNNTATLNVSVEIAMEDYVLGISEMPYYWGTSGGGAALEAQAVAARSYAYNRMLSRGTPESRPWCFCQVYDTPVDQNYVGWGHGNQAWIDAVRNTANQVMFHPSETRSGVPTPISTFYSSSTYGWTENSENSFTASVAYLKAVDDHWGGLAVVGNGNYRWTRTFSNTQLAAALPGMNTVTGASITRCSVSGAALEVTFSGSGGPRAFHTRELRSLLGLRSQQVYAINGANTCAAPGGTTTTSTTTTTILTTTTTVPGDTTTTTIPVDATTTTTVPVETTTTTIPATTTTTIVPATTTTTVPATTTTTMPTTTIPIPQSCPAIELPIDALLASGYSLRPGARGVAVGQLQALLAALGHYSGPIDSVYGQGTTAGVRSFQDARGLLVDGVVGSRTRGELAALRTSAEQGQILAADGRLLRVGLQGDTVRALQSLLKMLGYDPGPIDGSFGSLTDRATKAFQRAEELRIDGVVGAESRAALASALGLGAIPGCG